MPANHPASWLCTHKLLSHRLPAWAGCYSLSVTCSCLHQAYSEVTCVYYPVSCCVLAVAILVFRLVWAVICHKPSSTALKTPVSKDHKLLQKTDRRQRCHGDGGGHLLSPMWRMSLREQNVGSGMKTSVSKLECGASKKCTRQEQLTRGEVLRPRKIFTKGPSLTFVAHHQHKTSLCKKTLLFIYLFIYYKRNTWSLLK